MASRMRRRLASSRECCITRKPTLDHRPRFRIFSKNSFVDAEVPHSTMSSSTGAKPLPSGIRLYSTFGGTTSNCLRWISSRCCSSFNSQLRTRGVTGLPSVPLSSDARISFVAMRPLGECPQNSQFVLAPAVRLKPTAGHSQQRHVDNGRKPRVRCKRRSLGIDFPALAADIRAYARRFRVAGHDHRSSDRSTGQVS